MPASLIPHLVRLCHALGDPARDLVIHGEGDASCKVDGKSFMIKASGQALETLDAEGLAHVSFGPLLELVEGRPNANGQQIRQHLQAACAPGAPQPSAEAFFHAVLLDLPGVKFVAHTHPTHVAGIMSSPKAELFANVRLFPHQAVLCGPRSLFVPYMDPGLPLAVELRWRLEQYMNQYGDPPSTVMLANHGMIALGATAEGVLSAMTMTQKAAQAFLTAQACGGAIPIPEEHVLRILGK